MTETQTFTEDIKQETTLPTISEDQITKIRKDAQKLESFKNSLYQNSPDELHNINKKYPTFFNKVNQVWDLLNIISEDNKSISDEDLKKNIEQYNSYAYEINIILNKIKVEKKEWEEKFINQAVNWEWEFDWIKENMYTKEDQEELKQFSKDLWEEFFPESNIDKFVRWVNNQEELEDYQKILLAPANWIENVIMWLASLVDVQTQDNIAALSDLDYEDWSDLWKTLSYSYENLDTTDKITPLISFLFSIWFLIWWFSKIGQLAEKLNLSSKLVKTIKYSTTAANIQLSVNSWTKVALIWTMAGITLPYIK